MAGRKPKPSKVHQLHGHPGKRKRKRKEPEPAVCIPKPPKHLNAVALKEWKRVAPGLEQLGILSEIDRSALAAYCQCYARWVDAEEKLEKIGVIVKSPSGYPMPSPYVAISNTALKLMRDFATEFGMTPSSRSRIAVHPKRQKTPFEEYLESG